MDILGFLFKRKKEHKIYFPSGDKLDMKSLQYLIFQEEEKQATIPKTIYEKLTHLSEKILHFPPSEKTKNKIQETIDFAHLKITPTGVFSFTIIFAMFSIILGIGAFFSGYFDITILSVYFIVAASFSYYLYYYPFHLRKVYELRAGSEVVMLILHIVIYMRNFPNLERAVKFASQNLTGPLSLDIKKLVWDVHVGTYESMEEAVLSFSLKWKKYFRAFSDSVNAIIYSLYTSGKRRGELLDESIDIILSSLNDRSNNYISNLKSPVTMINALGILLPTLVLTMLPIATIFLGDSIPPFAIFGFYDIILPILLIFIIKNVLDQRVITLPEPDLSLHSDLPPENTFKTGNFFIYSYLPSIIILLPFLYYGYINLELITGTTGFKPLYTSFIVTIGFFISLIVFFFLNSFQKIRIRHEVMEIEDEFRDILFGLGQEMDRGIPLEIGFEKILPILKGSYSANLVNSILTNIKYEGLTIEKAIFDEKRGAILKFPSKLIYSTLGAIVDAASRGTKIVSEIMISISRYLTNIHRTQQSLQDKFSEIIGSMQMQATILLPLICAVMNTLTYMIIEMIGFLKDTMGGLSSMEGAAAGYGSFLSLFESGLSISPGAFQIAIGFYVIETIIILSWFMNGISVGEDKVSLHDSIYKNLIIGGTLYIVLCLVSIVMLMPFLEIITAGLTPMA